MLVYFFLLNFINYIERVTQWVRKTAMFKGSSKPGTGCYLNNNNNLSFSVIKIKLIIQTYPSEVCYPLQI